MNFLFLMKFVDLPQSADNFRLYSAIEKHASSRRVTHNMRRDIRIASGVSFRTSPEFPH